MEKRENKDGSRIEKRICESVSNNHPLYPLFCQNFLSQGEAVDSEDPMWAVANSRSCSVSLGRL